MAKTYKEEKRKLWRPGSKLWYCTITKPLPCCNSSTLGYGSWKVAPRRISCTGDRSPAMEMLATRNL